MRYLWLAGLLWLVPGFAAPLITQQGNEVRFDTGALTMSLTAAGRQLRVTHLARPGGAELVTGDGGELWRVTLGGPGDPRTLGEAEASRLTTTTRDDRALFRWDLPIDSAACAVTMTVRVKRGDGLSYWSLEVAPPAGRPVTDAVFPRLGNLALRPGAKLAIPWCDGVEYDLKPGYGYEEVYPSMLVSMQMMALYAGGEGVYLGVHDARAGSKRFTAQARADGVELRVNPWPAIAAGPWRTGYETAVGVFAGGWRQAAALYRAFAEGTPWWRNAGTQPTPAWFRDTDLWLTNDASWFGLDTQACAKAGAYLGGLNKAIHWYNWYAQPGTMKALPECPPRDGFAAAVKETQAAGFRVMPYLDGRQWSRDNPTYASEHADQLAARRADGQVYEEYTNCVPMCPAMPRWHEKMAGVVKRVVTEYGADAAYVDEIGAARTIRCFAPDHGHPVGGGHWWIDGYRALAAAIRKAVPASAAFTTEHAADCYVGSFDGFCTVNNPKVPPETGRTIPLFTAVYAGRCNPFGYRYDDCTEDGFAHPLSFRQNQVDAFLRGAQLGWVHTRVLMQPKAAAEAAFLRNLARVRAQAHPFLVRGTFVDVVAVTGDNPPLTADVPIPDWAVWVPEFAPYRFTTTKQYRIDMPAVQASAWQSADGRFGVVAVNASPQARAVVLCLPPSAAGRHARVLGPEGVLAADLVLRAETPVTVPADGAVLVEVSAK